MTSAAATLRLACAGASPQLSPEAREALAACHDIDGLIQLAVDHRVAPWFAAAISGDSQSLSETRCREIQAAAGTQAFSSLRLFSELSSLLALLNSEEIPVVVLKGPVLAQAVYPDPGLRPYGDVDILIHERDLQRVSTMLVARGYREKNETHEHDGGRMHECHGIFQRIFINSDSGMVVEVHCDHLQIGLEPVGMDEIWASSTPVTLGRGTAGVLNDHDLFVQLCVHLQRHGFTRLIWWKDLDLMVRSSPLDWDEVARRAELQGCLGAVSYALSLLPRILRTPLPPGATRLAARQGRLSRMLYAKTWPAERVEALQPERIWRFRRLVQFAPETGFVRGGLPAFLTSGRRKDKVRVLAAGIRRSLAPRARQAKSAPPGA